MPGGTMRSRVRALLVVGSVAAAPALLAPATAHAATGRRRTVAAGETWEVTEVTRLDVLVVEEGAVLTAPEGHSLTLTVNGVETGSAAAVSRASSPPRRHGTPSPPSPRRTGGRSTTSPTPHGPPSTTV
ncbi:hypothetical protein [Streptomyces sp. NPDC047043]|uniref:hypothetical protein n=1 Tax=Streptomyces sp. NPDC047043 TaxID=3154497 RepID=UPI0033FBE9C2